MPFLYISSIKCKKSAPVRQALALSHILVHGNFSIQDFERLTPHVSRRTLQRDLKAMVEKGLIVEKASSPTDPTKSCILTGKLAG